jgi:hypothetical protein
MTASAPPVIPTEQWVAEQARQHAAALHDILAELAALRQQRTDAFIRLEAAESMLTPSQRAQLPTY